MNKLADIMEYILTNYPHKDDLSKARLTKLVYLVDWVQAIKHDKQVSSIEWYFDNYGPFVWDISNTALNYPDRFEIESTANEFGSPKKLISLVEPQGAKSLTDEEKLVIDFVIKQTSELGWSDFIRLVYSTHPIMTSPKHSQLDLVNKAREYANQPA